MSPPAAWFPNVVGFGWREAEPLHEQTPQQQTELWSQLLSAKQIQKCLACESW